MSKVNYFEEGLTELAENIYTFAKSIEYGAEPVSEKIVTIKEYIREFIEGRRCQ